MTGNIHYQDLLSRLDTIHGISSDREDAVNKLEFCRKKDDETMAMYAETIRQLIERAYPNFIAVDKEEQALRVFLQGLPSKGDIRLKMRTAMFQRLRDAVIYGTNLEQIMKEERSNERNRQSFRNVQMVAPSEFENDDVGDEFADEIEEVPLRKAIENMARQMSELGKSFKQNSKQGNVKSGTFEARSGYSNGRSNYRQGDWRGQSQGQRDQGQRRYDQYSSACFNCGQYGHWKSDCPQGVPESERDGDKQGNLN
jgi:hypothetical protein